MRVAVAQERKKNKPCHGGGISLANEGNSITDIDRGIELSSAGSGKGIAVSGNTIKGGDTYGMYVGGNVVATIEGNSISGAATGIWLDSNTVSVLGNTITGNLNGGLYLNNTSATLTNNTITGNSGSWAVNQTGASSSVTLASYSLRRSVLFSTA